MLNVTTKGPLWGIKGDNLSLSSSKKGQNVYFKVSMVTNYLSSTEKGQNVYF